MRRFGLELGFESDPLLLVGSVSKDDWVVRSEVEGALEDLVAE